MAIIEHTSTSVVSGRFGHTFSALVARLIDWNEKRCTRNALSQLTDRELQDIGLDRADIDSIR